MVRTYKKISNQHLKVLVLGYGAREHALAWKIAQSPKVGQIFVAPGNAGTAAFATNVDISDEAVLELVDFALSQRIDLTVVGTNDPLALGVVDAFQEAGLAIFGPNAAAAQLESSKAFAKGFMARHDIPTPAFEIFTDYEQALDYLDMLPEGGLVVKISGLGRSGLGVTVCDSLNEARTAVRAYMLDKILGESGGTILIEERANGPEVSVFGLSDGKTVVPLVPVRDHKRVCDGDRGPNTGGIGAYGPPTDLDEDFLENVTANILQPTVDGMANEGIPFVGVLFAGLMLTDDGVQVLEYNTRFGNPEALVLMTLLESDLVDIMLACLSGRLDEQDVCMRDASAATVVMTCGGYPGRFEIEHPIYGLQAASALQDVTVFHHGTTCEQGRLLTSRGRVLAVTAIGTDLASALIQAYRGVQKISFTGAHYRQDIGYGLPVA